ncbi:hypothetical protein ACFOEE_07080 [Pseudoalteromonas fenneropenaei]|uniref:Lipoprotein n=1 Tax=Pseudoalteromonas fenneropenaei TaxID=1737459 RepID=A0ABV7CI33_9GAMM
MNTLYKISLIILSLTLLTACARKVNYQFGYSGEDDERYTLVKAQFDNTGTPGGSLACCIGDGGSGASMFPDRYPKTGYFEWFDTKEGHYYRAALTYPKNLQAIAEGLSDVVYSSNKPSSAFLILITSFTNDKQVISFMANDPFGRDHIQREIVEVARAQGERFIPEFAVANCTYGERSEALHRFCNNVPEEIAAYRAKLKAEGKTNPQ